MAKVKSDIEIARKAKMKPISKILAKINVQMKVAHLVQWVDISQKLILNF